MNRTTHFVEFHGGPVTAHSEGIDRGACYEVGLRALTSPS